MLFESLQRENFRCFHDGQLKTLQSRVWEWRQVMAKNLVYACMDVNSSACQDSCCFFFLQRFLRRDVASRVNVNAGFLKIEVNFFDRISIFRFSTPSPRGFLPGSFVKFLSLRKYYFIFSEMALRRRHV